MPFEVKNNKTGKLYFVYSINFYTMGSVNPDVKFLLWDVTDQCWRVDYAANYIPTKHPVWSLKEKEEEKLIPVSTHTEKEKK